MMSQKALMAFACFVLFSVSTNTNVAAEQHAVAQISDLNCQTFYPYQASITDLNTGLGVALLVVDQKTDNIPPCSGNLPSPGITFGEYPLQFIAPQLAKVQTDQGQCSGNFIAPNAVITAGHCVFDQATKKFATNVQIFPGYQNGAKPYGTCRPSQVLTFAAYTASNMAAHDIAVLKMTGDCLPPQYGFYGMMAYNVAQCGVTPFPMKDYTEPHYSPDIGNNQTQAGAEGQVLGCVQGTISTRLPLGPGSSGSAVIDHYSRSVFAVHSQYSLAPPASYDAVLTKAKICVIETFLTGGTTTAPCNAGN